MLRIFFKTSRLKDQRKAQTADSCVAIFSRMKVSGHRRIWNLVNDKLSIIWTLSFEYYIFFELICDVEVSLFLLAWDKLIMQCSLVPPWISYSFLNHTHLSKGSCERVYLERSSHSWDISRYTTRKHCISSNVFIKQYVLLVVCKEYFQNSFLFWIIEGIGFKVWVNNFICMSIKT